MRIVDRAPRAVRRYLQKFVETRIVKASLERLNVGAQTTRC